MKIILIGPSFPYRGGIANFNDSLFSALSSRHETQIVSYSLQYPSFLFPGRTQYEEAEGDIRPGTIRAVNSINPFSWSEASAIILNEAPDLIVVQYWMPFFAPALGSILRKVKKKRNVRVVGIIHNIVPHENLPGSGLLNRWFLKACDGLITMSSEVANDAIKLIDTRSLVTVPHPVYSIFGDPLDTAVARENLGLDPDGRYLLFFGIIRAYKGLGILIDAMSDTRLEQQGVKLLVAGEFYEDKDQYLKTVNHHHLSERIIFTDGFVPAREVANYFSAADMVVLPYISATQSGVTQIAYHFDKPMLVTDVGGLKETVDHGRVGYVCRPDKDDIAGSIADFYTNNRANLFIENIRSEKNRFSWDRMVDAIERLSNHDTLNRAVPYP